MVSGAVPFYSNPRGYRAEVMDQLVGRVDGQDQSGTELAGRRLAVLALARGDDGLLSHGPRVRVGACGPPNVES